MKNAVVEPRPGRKLARDPGADPPTEQLTQREPLVNATVVRAWLDGLDLRPAQRRAVLDEIQLDESTLRGPDVYVACDVERRLVDWALRHRGRGIGVEAATRLDRGALALVEYLVRTSTDLGSALDQLLQYQRLLGSGPLFTTDGDRELRLRLAHAYDGDDRVDVELAEFALACVALVGRDAAASDWRPRTVRFTHGRPADMQALERVFRCPLELYADASELVVDNATLAVRMKDADPALHALLTESVRGVVEIAGPATRVVRETRRRISDLLTRGQMDLATVARALGMAPRTLQSRLQAEGTSFSRIADEVRMRLAQRYLLEDRLSVPDIAAVLGYSEASAFHRAFRRWTGTTPYRFRRSGDG